MSSEPVNTDEKKKRVVRRTACRVTRRNSSPRSLALLSGVVLGFVCAFNEPASASYWIPADQAFVLSSQYSYTSPTPADENYSWNAIAEGQPEQDPPPFPTGIDRDVLITQVATGSYRVDFPGQAGAGTMGVGGAVQVTAYGDGNNARCKVWQWGPTDGNGNYSSVGSVLSVDVLCFNPAGTLTNSPFTANYIHRTDQPGPEAAYVLVSNSSASSQEYNTGENPYAWSSTGGSITVNHTPGTGNYAVELFGQTGAAPADAGAGGCIANYGTVEVTASGGSNAYCKVDDLVPETTFHGQKSYVAAAVIRVSCFDGSTGLRTDSPFNMVYSTMAPNGTLTEAFAFGNQPGTASYSGNIQYVNMVQEYGDGQTYIPHCITSAPAMFRWQTGRYGILFSGLGNTVGPSTPSYVKVTAFGSDSTFCNVVNWGPGSNSDVGVNVQCFTAAGVPSDTDFMMTYSSLFNAF